MSKFENYTQTSKHYDLTRQPVGLEIILGALAASAKPLAQQTVLDAGCGTGNYAIELADKVGRLEGVELNPGMLAAARAKTADRPQVRLQEGSILELPIESGSCDGVTVNFVLHHVEDGADPDFAATRKAVKECARVLAPGGKLIIQTCSATQYREGYWYTSLIPAALERALRRYIPLDLLETGMEEAGLQRAGRFVPLDAVLQGEAYLDPRGPLRQEWRNGDSSWAFVEPEELAGVQREIERLLAEDRMNAFLEERERSRRQHGQATFLVAKKPLP